MVSLLTLTGAASLASIWVYQRLEKGAQLSAKRPWWKATWGTVQKSLAQVRQDLSQRYRPSLVTVMAAPNAEANAATRYGLRTAALALGTTTTGWLLFPPLQIAGLPLLVYMGLPAAQRAYKQLALDGRPNRALAETVVLAVCLAGGYYWIGSLGFCLYHGSRTLLAKPPTDGPVQGDPWATPVSTHLWKAGTTCAVPTAMLQPGDHLLLQSGEMTPVDGLIIEGMAWVQPCALSATACGLRKSVGSRITATDIVVVGRICVRVLPTA